MRRIVSAMLLAVAIGPTSAWGHDPAPPASAGPVPQLEVRAVAVGTETDHERGGWRQALSALERLRLRPGHDCLDRSASAASRQR